MRSGIHLGAILGRGRSKGGSQRIKSETYLRFYGLFWKPKLIKKQYKIASFFRSNFGKHLLGFVMDFGAIV